MSLNCNENENINNYFFNCVNESLFLSNINDMNDNTNYFINESKEEPQVKQQIKFILTKQNPPHETNLLQKKTSSHINDLEQDANDSNNGRWDKEEQKRFAEAVLKYGNDWKKIQNHVFSRNITQVRSHAQKYLMKLKENNFVKDKGLDKSMSWTKVMNFLRDVLNYEELKNILFSVEQNETDKKNGKKIKKIKKNKLNEVELQNFENNTHFDIDGGNSYFFLDEEKEDGYKYNIKNKIIRKEEDEEEMLKKFIECFNSPSGEVTLNTSFEDDSSEEEKGFKFLNDTSIKYSNSLNII